MRGRRVTCGFSCLLGAAVIACGESHAGSRSDASENDGGTGGSGGTTTVTAGMGAGGGAAGDGMTGVSGAPGAFVAGACVNGCGLCGYVDEDADGWGGGNLICIDEYPGAVSTLGGDCDDTNPDLQRGLWVDQDHDGAGIQGEFGCFGADEMPPGYANNGTDCVDDDPNFGPHVVDFAGDGLDRDCDGRDGGFDCGLEFPPPEVMAETQCAGFDLRPLDVMYCNGDCNLHRFARIANVGTQPEEGRIYVTSDSGEQVVMLEGLPANTVSEPFGIPYFATTFTLSTGEGTDCNPDNDAYTPPEPAGMRAFCSVR
jgi:hypothetical protein